MIFIFGGEIMIKLDIPFINKAKAREYGAIFNINDRHFYIPDDADALTIDLLKKLEIEEEPPKSTTTVHVNEPDFTTTVHVNLDSDKEVVDLDWDEILAKECPILTAYYLTEYNYDFTGKEDLLTRIFKNLAIRNENKYQIEYEYLYLSSDVVKALFPPERLTALINKVITGKKNYIEEINAAPISDLEKAFMYFALPM